ncbi:MAG TPA: PAS domain S-box protein [Terriglobales bacterium]|nr:PAS domain S-box protein [Terriglobales bacterium]
MSNRSSSKRTFPIPESSRENSGLNQPPDRASTEEAREYAALLDLAHDAIFVIDLEGRIKFWNQGAENLYGYARAEALGKSVHELLRTEFPIPLQDILERVRADREWLGDLVHYRKNGDPVVVASRWNAQYDDAGRLIGTFEINRDITQYKKYEKERSKLLQELQAAEEGLRLAQKAANVWTWEYDVHTGEVKRSEDLSPLYGLPAGTLDNKFETALHYVHPEDQQKALMEVQAALQDGEEHEMEYRIVRGDGRIAWLLLRGRARFEDGKAVRVLGIGMDITQRKRTEEALRSTERLAATGRLAATIAHELNNPLAAVANLLYLIEAGEGSDPASKNYAKIALQELYRASNIVKQTLSFHRDSNTPVPLKISELIDGILALYLPKMTTSHVSVEKRYEVEGDIRGFPGELRQVFSNLVINALEAMGRDGRLVVHIFPSHDGRLHKSGVRVVLADTGPGIPVSARGSIFEPFFTTKGEKGTGLGLWVTHGIVQKHGGSIRVRSNTRTNSSGTVFSLFFPVDGPISVARSRRRYEFAARGPVQLALPLAG